MYWWQCIASLLMLSNRWTNYFEPHQVFQRLGCCFKWWVTLCRPATLQFQALVHTSHTFVQLSSRTLHDGILFAASGLGLGGANSLFQHGLPSLSWKPWAWRYTMTLGRGHTRTHQLILFAATIHSTSSSLQLTRLAVIMLQYWQL